MAAAQRGRRLGWGVQREGLSLVAREGAGLVWTLDEMIGSEELAARHASIPASHPQRPSGVGVCGNFRRRTLAGSTRPLS